MTVDRIEVDGLKDLQRELRAVDKDFPKELRLANKGAAEIVADATRASFASRGGVAPKVAPSVKALAQQRSASVKIGGAKYPYAMGSEFGGRGRPRTRQFPPWRGNGEGAGYSLYESIRAQRDKVMDSYGDALDRLTKKAFPD